MSNTLNHSDISQGLTKAQAREVFRHTTVQVKARHIADFLWPAVEIYASDEEAFKAITAPFAVIKGNEGSAQEAVRKALGDASGTLLPSQITMGIAVVILRERARDFRLEIEDATQMPDVPLRFSSRSENDNKELKPVNQRVKS